MWVGEWVGAAWFTLEGIQIRGPLPTNVNLTNFIAKERESGLTKSTENLRRKEKNGKYWSILLLLVLLLF